jgi:hypothetical protein
MIEKDNNNIASKKTKDHWCSYSLQQLSPGKFIKVVGNILNGKYRLLASRKKPGISRGPNRDKSV